MRAYVEQRQKDPEAGRMARLLDRMIPAPELHGRFVNLLARLEYVGVRKMLKARRAEHLNVAGLEHMLDEIAHAVRLKKAALAVAGVGAVDIFGVETFSDEDTLGGSAGEDYFQAIDRTAETVLMDVADGARVEANYLLTSAAIEVRAQAFYPTYDARLRAHGAKLSVESIARDEEKHLAAMAARLEQVLPDWKPRLERVLEAERALFATLLSALEQAVDTEMPPEPERATRPMSVVGG